MNEPLSIVDTSVSFLDTLEKRSGKPLSAEEWLERAERLISVSRYGVAMRVIQELKIREPTDPNPWLLEVKCRIARKSPETAIKVCHDLEEIYADDSNVLAQIDQLRRIAEDSRQSNTVPPTRELPKITGADNVYGEVIVNKKPGSKSVILFFSGIGLVEGKFDAIAPTLDKLPAHNILLADDKRLVGLGGYGKLADSYDGTLSALKKICAELSAERIISVGASAGGLTAVYYGLALGASHIVSIAGPTMLTRKSVSKDRRILMASARIFRQFPDLSLDLADLIRDHKQPVKITHFSGASMPEDKMHADNIEGLPGVQIHRLAGVSVHQILKPLVEDGTLEKCLRDAIEGK